MANKIQVRRGLKAELPVLSSGEPGYCTDTKEFFVGTGSGNVNMGGSHWYTGTAMSGTSSSVDYSYSSCPDVKVGDMYLNTSYGYTYQCKTAGKGTAAKWQYKGSIRGAQGSYPTVDSSLSSSSVNPVQNKVIKSELDEKLDGSWSNANGYANIQELSLDVMDMWQYFRDGLAPLATVTIGTIDSAYGNLVHNSYICNGTNDEEQIQKAIDALPANGGKIVFLEGSYTISSALTCKKNVVFEGMGKTTVINCINHAFLNNTSGSCRIDVRYMAFNLSGNLTASAPFIKAAGNFVMDSCTVTAATSTSELWTDYIKTSGNANIVNSTFEVTAVTTIPSCAAIFGFTDGYNNTVLNCDIKLTNSSTVDVGLRGFNLYVTRGYDRITDCRVILVGKNSVNTTMLTEGSRKISGCYIDITNRYSSITKDYRTVFNGCFIGNEVHYANGAFIGCDRVSDNYFEGSGTLYFYGTVPIVTGNRFVNDASNTISGSINIIFKNNTLKYSCSVSSSGTAKVSDNIVYSSLT